ncbi:MAG: site-specific DNA-methyltransferase, partial [Bacteroidota bacterium]
DCFKTIQQPSIATLVPARDESIDFDTTENLFIEGDNLEVLKLLQKSYLGKVKMIYIDPPYNTGKEFVYPDNYAENLQTYLEYTGQIDSEGRKFGTNTDTDGRFHSKWLNMMYPRIFFAKNLLKEDGLIFISIDDNEVNNLRVLCNEIFGEENFISQIIWEKRYGRSNDVKFFSSVTDYVLLYRKSEKLSFVREPREESNNDIYSNPDNDPRGAWTSVSFVSQRTKEERPNLSYKITNPNTKEVFEHPVNSWKYSEDKFNGLVSDNRLHWGKDGTQKQPRIKRFLSELPEGLVPVNLWKHQEVGTGEIGTREVDALLGKEVFTYPKPSTLLKKIIKIGAESDSIILDFFAGSGSTAHAVMELNKEDGGNRKFICVQIPEPTDEKSEAYKAGYKNIAEISKERIRRVADKIKKVQDEKELKESGSLFYNQNNQDNQINQGSDLGFKVLKLDHSNFKIWDATLEKEPEAIQQRLFEHIDHISPEAAQESILYELLLKSGFELTTPIEKLTLADKTVFSIAGGQLLICLEKELSHDCIKAMAELQPTRVICLDEAFTGVNADA